MHETGLARGVAKTLKSRGLSLAEVRLNVRGGHRDPADFETDLRVHLLEVMPDQAKAVPGLEIRRVPFGHLCPGCGTEFESAQIAAPCPRCHAESLPGLTDEQVDVERLEQYR
ncbi:MAG: hydrogenase/urease maturation nickel metallochaperone HypA [Candidatus Limnocylindrales bacterium]|jgi:Zn finger protein HypA/HybF involved in hydrogenase expression